MKFYTTLSQYLSLSFKTKRECADWSAMSAVKLLNKDN